ncbi:MAG: tetratricopeptide repeat protein, partial [Gemmatimonadaceae bacterium]|nr:tetratricopeptide repeat protein [Gemmatimonadaceae bacterium]
SAERDRFSYRLRKFVRRNRVGVAAGSVVAVLLVAFAASMSWQARQLARERDRVQVEKAATESVVALLTSLFARANPVTVPGGDTLRVQQLLAAGETLVDSLAGQPYLQARMWRVLGTMHYARGRVDAAERMLQRAYDSMMSIRGSDSLEVAQIYHELARAVEAHQGTPRALPLFTSSVERLRRAPGVSAKDIMIAERELAERSILAADSRRALEALVAKKSLTSANDSMEYAASLNALASERYASGNMREAVVLFTETLRYLELLLPDGHPNRLIVAGNVAMARRDYGEFDVAEGIARTVLAEQKTQITENPIAVAGAIERLASTQALRGFLEDAERGYREARRIEQDLLSPTHSMIMYNQWSLAFVVDARGRPREASQIADSAMRTARSTGSPPMDTLALTDLRALFLMHQQQWQAAERMLLLTGPKMRALTNGPHMSIDSHETWMGMLALGQARYEAAIGHFTAAAAGKRARLLGTHPDIAGDDCGRGIALAKLERAKEATPLLRDACRRYVSLGTHSRLIARWAEEVK